MPLLFLSHSGNDTESARRLVEKIEKSSEARKRGIKVWLDKRDLKAGHDWQQQLEMAIEKDSTAFAVYVGSNGIVNWVEREVRLALERATRTDEKYPFIPIVSSQARGKLPLPAFARQYQAVYDVENDSDQFGMLIRAILGELSMRPIVQVERPFVGLRAFEEKESHLFFGRKDESLSLIKQLKTKELIVVVGDSGSGKSSLVKAGLVPLYRGGGMADVVEGAPADVSWHVIETRPGRDPFQQLSNDLIELIRMQKPDVSLQDLGSLREQIKPDDIQKTVAAIKDMSPIGANILLVVDQFEELFTTVTTVEYRKLYIDFLLAFIRSGINNSISVVITMRRDYYNLCFQFPDFFKKAQQGKFQIHRMKDEQLLECIINPLKMAGEENVSLFAISVIKDVGDQPGDLALLEMALNETWLKRHEHYNDLLQTYHHLGEVTGVLANKAEDIFNSKSLESLQVNFASVFMRLVQLGDTGGATRRLAEKKEFSSEQWELIGKLSNEEFRRLVVISGDQGQETVELSHEALITQWPRFQIWLQEVPELKGYHDKIIFKAKQWDNSEEKKKESFLLMGNDLAEGINLKTRKHDMLSEIEIQFINTSNKANQKRKKHKKLSGYILVISVLAMFLSIVFITIKTEQFLVHMKRSQAQIDLFMSDSRMLLEIPFSMERDMRRFQILNEPGFLTNYMKHREQFLDVVGRISELEMFNSYYKQDLANLVVIEEDIYANFTNSLLPASSEKRVDLNQFDLLNNSARRVVQASGELYISSLASTQVAGKKIKQLMYSVFIILPLPAFGLLFSLRRLL